MRTPEPDGVGEVPPGKGRPWLRVVVIAVVMVLISGGLWGWKHRRAAQAGPRPVVWLLKSGKIQGRVQPGLVAQMKAGPGKAEIVLEVTGRSGAFFSRDRKMVGLGEDMGSGTPVWPAFLMMDAQDRIYVGWPSGDIRGWDGASGELDSLSVDQNQVRAAYEKETGKAWVGEPGGVLRAPELMPAPGP